jgi:hypothetical protein
MPSCFVSGAAGGRSLDYSSSSLFILAPTLTVDFSKILEDFGIKDWGADLVDSGGPFSQVDFAATVAAEWEVLVFRGDEHAAGGAMQELCGFFSGCHLNYQIFDL